MKIVDMKTAYVYVDGENHFLRSSAVLAELHGRSDAAQLLALSTFSIGGHTPLPSMIAGRRFGWEGWLAFHWDSYALIHSGFMPAVYDRFIYATSCSGDDDKIHEGKVFLRKAGFEPIVVEELKQHAASRASALSSGVIDKAKGCDIALATRMVVDAADHNYDIAVLFTSDADFIPAVEAVRRMGKTVWVAGFAKYLPKRSPYLHVPDRFVDLEQYLKSDVGNWRGEYKKVFDAHPAPIAKGTA